MGTKRKSKSPRCGLIPEKWGPCFWLHIHIVAAGFSPKEKSRKAAYMRYFKDIGHILPCFACRKHYKQIITQYIKRGSYKSKFSSRSVLQRFVFDIHNKINIRLKKPVAQKTILKQYSKAVIEKNFRAEC